MLVFGDWLLSSSNSVFRVYPWVCYFLVLKVIWVDDCCSFLWKYGGSPKKKKRNNQKRIFKSSNLQLCPCLFDLLWCTKSDQHTISMQWVSESDQAFVVVLKVHPSTYSTTIPWILKAGLVLSLAYLYWNFQGCHPSNWSKRILLIDWWGNIFMNFPIPKL